MGGRLLNAEQLRKSYPTKMNGDDTWQKGQQRKKISSPRHIAASQCELSGKNSVVSVSLTHYPGEIY